MPEMTNKIGYITTYTGKVFVPTDPKPEMICIEDIAHALSNLCRFTGHVEKFYSVAQHSVLMAQNDKLPGNPLVKLLHDATEAYIGDIASPWKKILSVKDEVFISVKMYEQALMRIIEEALKVDLSPSAEVKESDTRMFWTEVRDLMPDMGKDFDWGAPRMEPVSEKINPWRPDYSEYIFLKTYRELRRG